MEDLSDRTLEQMIELAQEVSVLDNWEKVGGTVVFQLASRTIAIREPFAKTFVRGLLRGYELAVEPNRGK